MKIIKDMFDTSILGQDVYKMTLDDETTNAEIEKAVRKIRSGILFCFTPLTEQHVFVLEKLQFHLVSIRNTYKLTGTVFPAVPLPADYSIAPFASSDSVSDRAVSDLAQNICMFSRYYKDTLIPRKKSKEIYVQWVKNSLYKGYAQQCFLAWHKDKPIGMCTVKIKDDEGFVDLLGVLPGYQDKKIGTQLLVKSIHDLQSRKVHNIFVVTEGENIKANIFYERNHFVIHSVHLVYHKHF